VIVDVPLRAPGPVRDVARRVLRAGVAVAVVVAAGIAMSAEPLAVKPTMHVGDSWTFRSSGGPAPPHEWTEEVLEVLDGGRYRARVAPTSNTAPWIQLDGPGNVMQVPPSPTLLLLAFPLTVGKHWTSEVADTPVQTRAIDYRVAGVERLRTRVGEFDCLRIEGHETTSVDTVAVVSQGTIYYCPAVRHIALRETRIPSVGLVRQELVAYRPASPSSPSSTFPGSATP